MSNGAQGLRKGGHMVDERARAKEGKAARAYRQLRGLIASGELDSVAHLTQAKACELTGMSQGVVREAMLKLEGRGLLGSRGHSRGRVVHYLEDQDREDLIHRYEVRRHIEAGIVGLAAKNMTGRQLDRLGDFVKATIEAMETDDRQRMYELYLEFLNYLLDHCGNPLLRDIWERYRLEPTLPRSAEFDAMVVRSLPENERGQRSLVMLAEAIVAHDADRAEQIVRERINHITEVLRTMEWEDAGKATNGKARVESEVGTAGADT